MKLVTSKIALDELKRIASVMFDDAVKTVVDTERGIMMVDASMHSDQEAALLKDGSLQQHLWGVSLYPYNNRENFIEFNSMINLRPSWGNRSRGVDDPNVRKLIVKIVDHLVEWT